MRLRVCLSVMIAGRSRANVAKEKMAGGLGGSVARVL